MTLPKQVTVVEVGPRDGLQNEPLFVPTELKIALINQLSQTGLKYIESGSFVSPKAIPQLADSGAVFEGITRTPGIDYGALVPNLKGFERAMHAGVSSIAVFASASETFSQTNINCSIEQSLNRFAEVFRQAKQKNIAVRAYLSCVLACPYEGDIAPSIVATLAERLLSMGAYQVSLGDTIGIGTPLKTTALIDAISQKIPLKKIALHFHNTYGQALANVYASLQRGISVFDSSIAGLGGCPYATGASGNVASEDLLFLLKGLHIDTGIDLRKMVDIGNSIAKQLGRRNDSHVGLALA